MRHPHATPDVSGQEPAEGRPDMDLPGADHGGPISDPLPADAPDPGEAPRPDVDLPESPESDLPRRLGERIENGPAAGVAGEPDLVPDVEVPEETI